MRKQNLFSVEDTHLRAFEHLFLSWLFANDLYTDFTNCLRDAGCKTGLRSYVARFFNNSNRSPYSLISSAFDWMDTPQGPCFWNRASENWKVYLSRFVKSLN